MIGNISQVSLLEIGAAASLAITMLVLFILPRMEDRINEEKRPKKKRS
mgnify:CR=1 FL=1